MKICFITAITGNYETRLHEPIAQTINCDFIAFTNQPIYSSAWTTYPANYHPEIITNPYSVAKWYKLQWHKIDLLKMYDFVVWIDGSIEISNKRCAEWIVEKNNLCTMFSHEWRNGMLINEALGMKDNKRYDAETPVLTLDKYYNKGFKETYFRLQPCCKHPDYGVWITCFIAWKNIDLVLPKLLDDWWYEHLHSTKNDQLSLPYVLYKHKVNPYCLPDNEIQGVPHHSTSFYTKYPHGK